jgi:hypothetical protein
MACSPIPKIGDTAGKEGQETGKSTIVILPAKPKITGVNIEWLTPSPAEVNISEIGGKVEIKIRITSLAPINPEQIDVYINGVLLGNKADEVSLLKRPDYNDQIMTMHVPVMTGSNAVQVVVTKGSDQRYFAERILMKDTKGIRIKPAAVTGSTRIIWVDPDAISLEGEMFSTKTKELGIRLNITSPEVITKDKIQVLLNRKYYYPTASATLIGQAGNYIFKDMVKLDENVDINEIALKVQTSSGNIESDYLKINYSPVRPNVYLLSIGARLNLKYAYKDARDFAKLYSKQSHLTYKLFNTVSIDTLIGDAATTSEMRGMIETIKAKLRTGQIAEDDIVMLFISSHGFMDERGDFRIQGSDYSPERRMTTSVSYKNDILVHLEELPCKKLILIDACHSGGARANSTDILSAIHDIRNAPRGFAILTSSSKDEESYEDVKWQNGAFTEGIMKGMKDGLADANSNGIISLLELESYLKRVVPEMVKEIKSKPQNPLLSRNDIGDLPIFIIN